MTSARRLTSSTVNQRISPRDESAVDALADVLRSNKHRLYQCQRVPVEAGSVTVQYTKTPLRDLADGRLWDASGHPRGVIDYELGQIRLDEDMTPGLRPIGVTYDCRV